jgi:pyrroline-5-carboxylate reductase
MKVAIIGCGVIGSALAHHFAKKNSVILCDRTPAKSEALGKEIGAKAVHKHTDAIAQADVVILAIKPKDLHKFAEEAVSAFKPNQILVSALGGTSIATLQRYFSDPKIIRCLPNIPMLCGEGVVGFVENGQLKESIDQLFDGLGLLVWLSEEKLEGLSALAGSGPAFVYVLIEAMIDSGVYLGFTAHESKELVLKTLEGSIKLLRETGLTPAELKLKVASPGGTTIAGLKALEEGGVRGALMKTYEATLQKLL